MKAFKYFERAGRHGSQTANLGIAETLINYRHEMSEHLPLRLATDLATKCYLQALDQEAHASTVLSEIKIIEGDYGEAERLALEAYNLQAHIRWRSGGLPGLKF